MGNAALKLNDLGALEAAWYQGTGHIIKRRAPAYANDIPISDNAVQVLRRLEADIFLDFLLIIEC